MSRLFRSLCLVAVLAPALAAQHAFQPSGGTVLEAPNDLRPDERVLLPLFANAVFLGGSF